MAGWKPGTRLVTDERILSSFEPRNPVERSVTLARSTRELAEMLVITEQQVRRRLKKLVRDGKVRYVLVHNDSPHGGRKKWLWSLKGEV